MNPNQTEAYKYLGQAQQARKAGDKRLARQYAEEAARLAPELEDVWLMMGALASPRASVVFMDMALKINPQSERVRQGMHWAVERLRKEVPPQPVLATYPISAPVEKSAEHPHIPFVAILLTVMCLVVLASAAWAAPSMASTFIANSMLTGDQSDPAWAAAQIAKPTYTISPSQEISSTSIAISTSTEFLVPTATATQAGAATPRPTSTSFPTQTATPIPTKTAVTPTEVDPPTPLPTEEGTVYPSPTALPTDTAIPQPTVGPQATQYTPQPGANNDERWIDVDLTNQMVYAYEGNTLVNSFVTSTGTWQYPTVTGQYHVYVKLRYKHMSGPGYSLPNVPYTMFFYQGYAIHGTYWHTNFGTPMSHGCVNLSIPDAEWIYNFASVGTLVNVHY